MQQEKSAELTSANGNTEDIAASTKLINHLKIWQSLFNSSFNVTAMLKMFMWDAAIMRYPVFYKKKTFHGLFFEEN